MKFEKELEHQILKLKKVIRKLVLTSKEFEGLRHLLREGSFELQIYLIPLVVGSEGTRLSEEDLRFELTKEDKSFLKRAGITFE